MFATSRKNSEDAPEAVRKGLLKWYAVASLGVLHMVTPASPAQLKAVVSSNFDFIAFLKSPGVGLPYINFV